MKRTLIVLLITLTLLFTACSPAELKLLDLLPGDRACFGDISYEIPRGYSLSSGDISKVIYKDGKKIIVIDLLEREQASDNTVPKTAGSVDGWYEEADRNGSIEYRFEIVEGDSLYRISSKSKEAFWEILEDLQKA